MTVGHALPRLCARVVAVVLAGAVASLAVVADAQAHAPSRARRAERASHPDRHRYLPASPSPASAPPAASIVRTASSPDDFGDHQRSGHMTPEERHLLRQHIEDAVRELYRR